MKNLIENLATIVNSVPEKDSFLFKTNKGKLMPISVKCANKKGEIVVLKKEDVVNDVLVELFGNINVTGSNYMNFKKTIEELDKLVFNNLSNGAKQFYRKKVGNGSARNENNLIKNLKWSKKAILEITKKEMSRTELKIANESAYRSALKFGWLKDVCVK